MKKALEITLANNATISQQTTAVLDAIVKAVNMPAGIDATAFISNVTTNHTTVADFNTSDYTFCVYYTCLNQSFNFLSSKCSFIQSKVISLSTIQKKDGVVTVAVSKGASVASGDTLFTIA